MTLALVSTLQKEARATFSKAVIESPAGKPEHDKSGKGQKGVPAARPSQRTRLHVYLPCARVLHFYIKRYNSLSVASVAVA